MSSAVCISPVDRSQGLCRKTFATDDANWGSRRRNQPDYGSGAYVPEFHRGLVTSHAEAFVAGENKFADGWIG